MTDDHDCLHEARWACLTFFLLGLLWGAAVTAWALS